MTETWKAIPEWEGYYEVSDHGRVRSVGRSLPRINGRPLNLRSKILKGSLNQNGYVIVALNRDNRKVGRGVHRLVLLAFVGPAPAGTEACHFDGNPANNRIDNLRWDTRSGNTYDRVRHGTHSQARKTHCRNGHSYDDINTYVPPGRYQRMCKTCVRAAKARYNAKVAA